MAHWITEEDGERVWGLTDAEQMALLEEMEPHVGKWVQIHTRPDGSETVVGAGDTLRASKEEAEARGFKDTTSFFVPQGGSCGSAFLPKHSVKLG